MEYLKKLKEVDWPYDDVVKTFFETESDWTSAESWTVIKEYVPDYDSEYFQFLLENRDEFELLYGEEPVSSKIKEVYREAFNPIIYAEDEDSSDSKKSDSLYVSLKNHISKSNFPDKGKLLLELDLAKAIKREDWKEASTVLTKIDTGEIPAFFRQFNLLLGTVVGLCKLDDKNDQTLRKMLYFLDKMIAEHKYSFFFWFKGIIFYSLHDHKSAIEALNQAVEFADPGIKSMYEEYLSNLKQGFLPF